MQLVMYGTDGSFQPPVALPFDNSLLGQKFQFYLENILMPGGASLPAQLVIDAVGAGETNTIASAFDDAIKGGYEQELVPILQRVSPQLMFYNRAPVTASCFPPCSL